MRKVGSEFLTSGKLLTSSSHESAFMEMRNGDRETALLSALDCDSLDVAKFLVKEGANVFVRDRVGCKYNPSVES
jgi:hypothetical protein